MSATPSSLPDEGTARWQLALSGMMIALGGLLLGVQVDVSDITSVEAGNAQTVARFGSVDILVNSAGIAGPTGGTPEKPVGTVFIGLSSQDETIDIPCQFRGDRWKVQELTAVRSLDLVRRFLLGIKLQST